MSKQREEILASACELYLERGLEGFSMRRLARGVGVTAPALYRHFEGKEDVLLAVVGEAYRTLAEYLYGALSGSTPAERFRMASEAYLAFALDHPRYYQMIHAPLAAVGVTELPEEVEAQACAVGQFWYDRLREAMDAGLIRRTDPEALGPTMWAHAHGLISLYLHGMLGETDEATFRNLYRASFRRVLRGVGADGWQEAFADREATDTTTGAESR